MTPAPVLHLTPFLQGGAGRTVTDLALAARDAGGRVIVVTSRTAAPGYEHYPAYLRALERAGVETVLVDSLFARAPALNRAAEDAAVAALAGEAPRVIHAHAAVPAAIGLRVGARLGMPRPPVVQTMHGWNAAKRPDHARQDLASMRDVDVVVFPSAASAADLARLGGRFRATRVVPAGIPAVAARPVVPAMLAPLAARRDMSARVLLTIGSLTSQKNQQVLIEALPAIARAREVVALLVGEGPETAALGARAVALGVGDRVWFTGYLPDATAVLPLADLLVQPSRTESFGMAVIEAFRARVPVAASAIPALAELVRPGETGWRFDADEPADLARAALEALGADAPARNAILDRAEAEFRERFTVDRMLAGYARLYDELAAAA
ncbi:MAG: glycosyltransferase family 4 protein [Vicinamibacterales bacterium]